MNTHKCGHEMDVRYMGRGMARTKRLAEKSKTLCNACHRAHLRDLAAKMCVLLDGYDVAGKRNRRRYKEDEVQAYVERHART